MITPRYKAKASKHDDTIVGVGCELTATYTWCMFTPTEQATLNLKQRNATARG